MTHIPPTPHEAAAKKEILAHQYSIDSERMGKLEQMEAMFFSTAEYKSDKAGQRMWDATAEGQELIYLKRKCKGVEKSLSALSSIITVATNQARNNY